MAGLERDDVGIDGHAERDADAAQAHDRRRHAAAATSRRRSAAARPGSVASGTSALRPCSRNSRITSTTTATSSPSARSSVWRTRVARSARSYVVATWTSAASARVEPFRDRRRGAAACGLARERALDLPRRAAAMSASRVAMTMPPTAARPPRRRARSACPRRVQARHERARRASGPPAAGALPVVRAVGPTIGSASRIGAEPRTPSPAAACRTSARRDQRPAADAAATTSVNGQAAVAQLARSADRLATCAQVAADGRHLGDARDRCERRAEHIILEPAQPSADETRARIGQRVLEDPAGARRRRADARCGRSAGARAVPPRRGRRSLVRGVQPRHRREHDVDVRHAGHRRAADRLRAGTSASASVSFVVTAVGDLGRRVSHPVGDEPDLGIGQIRDHVARQPAARADRRPPATPPRDDDPVMARAPRDEAGDHGRAQRDLAGVGCPGGDPRRRRTSPARRRGRCGCRPDSTTAKPCFEERLADLDRALLERVAVPDPASTYGPSGDCSDRRGGDASTWRGRRSSSTCQPIRAAPRACGPPRARLPRARCGSGPARRRPIPLAHGRVGQSGATATRVGVRRRPGPGEAKSRLVGRPAPRSDRRRRSRRSCRRGPPTPARGARAVRAAARAAHEVDDVVLAYVVDARRSTMPAVSQVGLRAAAGIVPERSSAMPQIGHSPGRAAAHLRVHRAARSGRRRRRRPAARGDRDRRDHVRQAAATAATTTSARRAAAGPGQRCRRFGARLSSFIVAPTSIARSAVTCSISMGA